MSEHDEEHTSGIAGVVSEGGLGLTFPTESDALHGWMAATQCALNLGFRGTLEAMEHEHPHVNPVWALQHFPSGDDKDVQNAYIDKMGDAAKLLFTHLGAELVERGLTDVRILVFLPCHGGLATVIFKENEDARILEWQ